jgi:hypothetical protein
MVETRSSSNPAFIFHGSNKVKFKILHYFMVETRSSSKSCIHLHGRNQGQKFKIHTLLHGGTEYCKPFMLPSSIQVQLLILHYLPGRTDCWGQAQMVEPYVFARSSSNPALLMVKQIAGSKLNQILHNLYGRTEDFKHSSSSIKTGRA